MTPIEKSRAEDSALRILGLQRTAIKEEIKTAWRRKVVETHPDRNGGDASRFQLVQAAFEVANGTAPNDVIERVLDSVQLDEKTVVADEADRTPSHPRRARVKTRLLWINPNATPMSRTGNPRKVENVELSDTTCETVNGACVQKKCDTNTTQGSHTVERVRQKGRRVSYIIYSAVKVGPNQVSVLTGDFRRPGGGYEVSLQFASESDGPATVSVPQDIRETHFPGAQSVRLHFSHGADVRP